MKLVNTISMETEEGKKKVFNALNGVDSIQLKNCIGMEITIQDIVMKEDPDGTGEDKVLICIIGEDGKVFQTLSPTVYDSLMLMEGIFAYQGTRVRVSTGRSKQDRDFLKLEVV